MRRLSLRVVVLACLLSTAVPMFAAPRQDESGFDRLINRIVRVIRHVLPFDTSDPNFPRP